MITITIPTPMEAIQGIKIKKEIRNELQSNLDELRKARGKARVRWAETRFQDDAIKSEVDAINSLITMAEKALANL